MCLFIGQCENSSVVVFMSAQLAKTIAVNRYTNVPLFLSAASCVPQEENILQLNDKLERLQVNLPRKGVAGSSINSSRSAEAMLVKKRETGLSINFVPFKIFPAFIIDLISLDSQAITLKTRRSLKDRKTCTQIGPNCVFCFLLEADKMSRALPFSGSVQSCVHGTVRGSMNSEIVKIC